MSLVALLICQVALPNAYVPFLAAFPDEQKLTRTRVVREDSGFRLVCTFGHACMASQVLRHQFSTSQSRAITLDCKRN